MMAIFPVMMVLTLVFWRYVRRFSKEVQSRVADSNTVVEKTLQEIQSVKVFTNEYLESADTKKLPKLPDWVCIDPKILILDEATPRSIQNQRNLYRMHWRN